MISKTLGYIPPPPPPDRIMHATLAHCSTAFPAMVPPPHGETHGEGSLQQLVCCLLPAAINLL